MRIYICREASRSITRELNQVGAVPSYSVRFDLPLGILCSMGLFLQGMASSNPIQPAKVG